MLVGLIILVAVGWLTSKNPNPFFVNDSARYHLPGFTDAARAVKHGELPWLSSSSWLAGNLAGEYQFGVFSLFLVPLYVLVTSLPLPFGEQASLLASVHLLLLAAGTLRLARRFGADEPGAAAAALTVSLNGTILCQGGMWPNCLFAVAWLPWFWDALLTRSLASAVVCLYLLLTAGWPFAVAMALLLTAGSLAARQVSWTNALAAWTLGAACSAPAWMALLEMKQFCTRQAVVGAETIWTLALPPSGLLGLCVPDLFTDFHYLGTQLTGKVMAGGLIPLVIVLGNRAPWPPRQRALAMLVAVSLLLSIAPQFSYLRYSFRWLPVTFLGLGLLTGLRLAGFNPACARAPVWPAVIPFLVGGWAWHLYALPRFFIEGLLLAGAIVILRSSRGWRSVAILGLAALCSYGFDGPNIFIDCCVGEWAREAHPLEAGRLYLSLFEGNSDGSPGVRDGNVPMLAPALRYVNGYSPLDPRGISGLFHISLDGHGLNPGAILSRPDVLSLAGVDGLILDSRVSAFRSPEWHLVDTGPHWTRYDREPRSPLWTWVTRARSAPLEDGLPSGGVFYEGPPGPVTEYTPGRCSALSWHRNWLTCEVVTNGPALLTFSRPYFPGYRAYLDDKRIPVRCVDGALLGVELPPGARGIVKVDYFPVSLQLGFVCSAIGWCLVLAILLKKPILTTPLPWR